MEQLWNNTEKKMRFSQRKNKELGPFLPEKVSETGK